MRLIRLGQETSQVGADVRAALSSWGRGDGVVGGVALVGCTPPDCPRAADAIVVLPRGILVVVGVDLPDPAVRLDAPLSGQWKTDGWPLVRTDGAVNPGAEALEVAEAVTERLHAARVEPLPVGTVVAVGPYVSQVFQPTSDLLRGVRILHPEPSTLLTASKELATHERRASVSQVLQILQALQPDHPRLDPAELVGEGFTEGVSAELSAASTALIPRIAGEPERPAPPGRKKAKPAPKSGAKDANRLRWLPLAAALLIAVLLITGIAVAIASATGDDGAGDRQRERSAPSGIPVEGTDFVPRGVVEEADCAARATGDVQVWLRNNRCSLLIRSRYEVATDSGPAAVLVSVLRFPESGAATELRALADRPGTGTIADPAAEGVPWPGTTQPVFESAAYVSGREGNSVKLVQAVRLSGPSTPDDPALLTVAQRALLLPVRR